MAIIYYTKDVKAQPGFRAFKSLFHQLKFKLKPASHRQESPLWYAWRRGVTPRVNALSFAIRTHPGDNDRYDIRVSQKGRVAIVSGEWPDVKEDLRQLSQWKWPKTAKELAKPYEFETLRAEVDKSTVCMVCCAEYVKGSGLGKFIDSHDRVMRLSHASQFDLDPADYGAKQDLWVFNTTTTQKLRLGVYDLPKGKLILHMNKFTQLTPPEFYPAVKVNDHLMQPVSTMGVLLTQELLKTDATKVSVVGMDFFRSSDPYASSRGEPALVRPTLGGTKGHHYGMDEDYFRHMKVTYGDRLSLDNYLQEIVDGKHPR